MAARSIARMKATSSSDRNGRFSNNTELTDTSLASSTLKRHPKMDLNKNDLLRLLSHLEGEIQARDISIAALKADKARQLLFQAKYGRFGLSDPFCALQRDSDNSKDTTFDENAMKAMYDDQLSQLENLITTQRQAHVKMREQLAFAEKKYHKACSELEEEKRKHAQDTAQGDDVTYMLEKERERLRNEVDFEKNQSKKLEKEVKKTTTALDEEKTMSAKHKQVALMLIKERKSLTENYVYERKRNQQLSKILNSETGSGQTKKKQEELTSDSKNSPQLEAQWEKKISDLEFEREQLRMKLNREENRNKDMQTQLDSFKDQIEVMNSTLAKRESVNVRTGGGPKSIEIKSSTNKPPIISPRPTIKNKTESQSKQATNTTHLDKNSPPNLPAKPVPSPAKIVPSSEKPAPPGEKPVITSTSNARISSCDPSYNFDPSQHDSADLDFLGQEMADLQQLLVSMAIGEGPTDITPITANTLNITDSPLHRAASENNIDMLKEILLVKDTDVNIPILSGTTPLHLAAENGCIECLNLLLARSANASACRDDKTSPLHLAAANGHLGCVEALLDHGIKPSPIDIHGRTPLHLSATGGHSMCCQALLNNGAKITLKSNASLTPAHLAVQCGHLECLSTLLSFRSDQMTRQQQGSQSSCDIINVTDNDGWTIVHLAATKKSKKFLECIKQYFPIDLEKRVKSGNTLFELASSSCRDYLDQLGDNNEKMCAICIETSESIVPESQLECFTIGLLKINSELGWSELEGNIGDIITSHFTEVGLGMRTKKTNKFDQIESPDGAPSGPYSLGLTLNSIKQYSIGLHSWSPGTHSEKSPFEILCNNEAKQINVELFGSSDSCHDNLSYQTLIPIVTIQNYLRLVEQYKTVVFYGPCSTGKTYMANILGHCVQMKEQQSGNTAEIYMFNFTGKTTRRDFYNFLIEKGCLIYSHTPCPDNKAPIVILDGMANITIPDVFADLLNALDPRGPENCVPLKVENTTVGMYYLHSNCYMIGTMDRSRSTGLELSIQQKFRWVHCRVAAEPIKGLLSRHMYRKLVDGFSGRFPPSDDQVYKAVEWVICVWQRLNEGLGKLGLPELVIGPSSFLSCPIEENKSKAIIRWLSLLWNHQIAPAVCEAVIKGSGSPDTSAQGQQKVANTALYVLMQRAIVSGCPLTGQEKERYLASFHGSNELDIQMKDKNKPRSSPSRQLPLTETSSDSLLPELHVPSSPKRVSPESKASFSSNARNNVSFQPGASTNTVSVKDESESIYVPRKYHRALVNNTVNTGGMYVAPLTGVSQGQDQDLPDLQNNVHDSSVNQREGPASPRLVNNDRNVQLQRIQNRTQQLRNEFFKDFTPPRNSKSPSSV